jgi:hypothetical protein
VGSLIFILAPVLGVMGLATGFAIALGLVAARADEHFELMLADERAQTPTIARLEREARLETGEGETQEGESYAPPPEVTTAIDVAATTSTTVTMMTSRSPAASLGKLGRRSPIPSDTSSAHPTRRPPAI